MFPGKKIVLGDKEFVLPALSLKQLRNGVLDKLREHDELITNGKAYEGMILRSDIITTALQRNYPDIDEDFVSDNLDLSTVNDVWLTVLGVSSLNSSEAGQPNADPTISGPSTES